jgi:hypothetical protein
MAQLKKAVPFLLKRAKRKQDTAFLSYAIKQSNCKDLTENEPLTRMRLADGVLPPNLCRQKSRAIIAEDRNAKVEIAEGR